MNHGNYADLFKNWFWNLLAGITGPIFDGGRRRAEVERTRAVLEDQVAAYGTTVLTALQEVEDTLAQIKGQEDLVRELSAQVELTDRTWQEARERYINGLSDYLPVLTALTAKQQLQTQLLSAQRQRISLRIQLSRAVGGSRMKDLPRPVMPTEQGEQR